MSKYSENMPPDLKTAIGWMYDYLESHKVLLDFGCSTGYFGNLVKQGKQCQVYGVEISDDVKQARKVLDGVYSFDLDGEWPKAIDERKYDYLFFGDVLEHLKRPELVLQKSLRLLKPGGKVFVSIPNIAHISTRLELLQGNFEYESMGILDNTHLKYFTLQSFVRLAAQAGYAVEAVDTTADDYPREVVKKVLKKVGLTPTDTFWREMDALEARASQYKFVLVPANESTQPKKTVAIASLPIKPQVQRDDLVGSLRRDLKILHHHANEQAKIIDHYVALSKQLEAENRRLQAQPLRQMGRAIKSRMMRKRG